MKLCRHCRFYEGQQARNECSAEGNRAAPDYVTGEGYQYHWSTAQWARMSASACGPDAKWFEEKQPEQAAA